MHWASLPLGHAIMSIGRCHFKPVELETETRINYQMGAKYINEYGTWVGMSTVLIAVGLDLNFSFQIFLEKHMSDIHSNIFLFNLVFPHIVLIPLMFFYMTKRYNILRKNRIIFMIPLSLLAMYDSLITITFNQEFSIQFIWLYRLFLFSQCIILLMAFKARLENTSRNRIGKSYYINTWRYGLLFFITSHSVSILIYH